MFHVLFKRFFSGLKQLGFNPLWFRSLGGNSVCRLIIDYVSSQMSQGVCG